MDGIEFLYNIYWHEVDKKKQKRTAKCRKKRRREKKTNEIPCLCQYQYTLSKLDRVCKSIGCLGLMLTSIFSLKDCSLESTFYTLKQLNEMQTNRMQSFDRHIHAKWIVVSFCLNYNLIELIIFRSDLRVWVAAAAATITAPARATIQFKIANFDRNIQQWYSFGECESMDNIDCVSIIMYRKRFVIFNHWIFTLACRLQWLSMRLTRY